LAKLNLIPNFLGHSDPGFLATAYRDVIWQLDEFIVESEKSARAFLKAISHPVPQDDFIFHLMDKRLDPRDIPGFFKTCIAGKDIGLISDAGSPCLADPGSQMVEYALRNGVQVVPMAGLNSVSMALMASGFNGQQYRFFGYLPFDGAQRKKTFADITHGLKRGETQVFIETPYRNKATIEELTQRLDSDQELVVASDISTPNERIERRKLKLWTDNTDHLHKVPAVFVLGKRR